MANTSIRRFDDVPAFQRATRPFLLAAEAEHNLLLGIISQLLEGNHGYREPIYLAAVQQDGAVVGCAYRTPPYKVGLTRMPVDAVPELAEDLHRVYPAIPAAMGPPDVAAAFARAWAALRHTSWQEGLRMGIYQADRIEPPGAVVGQARLATAEDHGLVEGWIEGFARDAHMPLDDPGLGGRLIEAGQLLLWLTEDGTPCSMAAAMGPTPNGIRIGYVYTPREHRRHGYGSAVTAELSRRQLGEGRRFCFLYTDLANPTSNAIYQRIGYRPVTEVVDVAFG